MDKDIEIRQRLEQWIKSTGKRKSIIAQELGISAAQLSQLLNGRDGLGRIMQERLRSVGADVDWILTGRSDNETDKERYIDYVRTLEAELDLLREERKQYLHLLKQNAEYKIKIAAEPSANYGTLNDDYIELEYIETKINRNTSMPPNKAAATSIH